MVSFSDNLETDDSWKLAIKKTIFILKYAFGALILAFFAVISIGVGLWLLPYFEFNILLDIFAKSWTSPLFSFTTISVFF